MQDAINRHRSEEICRIAYIGNSECIIHANTRYYMQIQDMIKRPLAKELCKWNYTLMEKWCELSLPRKSALFLYLSEDSASHQSFPSNPSLEARFTDTHEGSRRHSNAQLKESFTTNVSSFVTFRKWCQCLVKVWMMFVKPDEF